MLSLNVNPYIFQQERYQRIKVPDISAFRRGSGFKNISHHIWWFNSKPSSVYCTDFSWSSFGSEDYKTKIFTSFLPSLSFKYLTSMTMFKRIFLVEFFITYCSLRALFPIRICFICFPFSTTGTTCEILLSCRNSKRL